jgi:hypothetical protein
MGKELKRPAVGSSCLNTLHFPAQSFVVLQNDASSFIIGYQSIRGNSDSGRTVGMIAESAFRLLPPAHMPTSPHPRTPHFHATCPHPHILSSLLMHQHHHSHGLAIRRGQLTVIRRVRTSQMARLQFFGEISVRSIMGVGVTFLLLRTCVVNC